jgi:DinB family
MTNADGGAPVKPHFVMLAGYNAWANRRLYDAAETLSNADYRADRGVFFKSMHGTLNHLLVTDRIWMRRFTGTGDAPDRLDGHPVRRPRGPAGRPRSGRRAHRRLCGRA